MGTVPISEPQRLAILSDAIVYGENQAAKRHGVHQQQISRWLKPYGGLDEVRKYVVARIDAGLSETVLVMFGELQRRFPAMNDETIMNFFSTLMTHRPNMERTILPGQVNSEANALAVAGGQKLEQHFHFGDNVVDQRVAKEAMAEQLLGDFSQNGNG